MAIVRPASSYARPGLAPVFAAKAESRSVVDRARECAAEIRALLQMGSTYLKLNPDKLDELREALQVARDLSPLLSGFGAPGKAAAMVLGAACTAADDVLAHL